MAKNTDFRENAYAVIIGINKYQDEKIPDLQFARADAEGIYEILTDPELGRIAPDNVFLLLDEQATAKNIRSAIGTKIPQRAGENDMVFIYYAGHGVPVMNPKTRAHDGMEKYLAPTDAEVEDLRATGISMDEIQKFFSYLDSKQVIFFIDSCYSGEAGGRTFKDSRYGKRAAALTSEFLEDLAGEGRLVVTACDVNEVSLETHIIGHGLFTHYLMEGMKGLADKDEDGLVTIHELYDYVYEKVSQHARKFNASMKPILKGSIQGKIFLTQYETAKQKQVKSLHAEAQAHYDLKKFDEAYDSWQKVIQLMPEHEIAQRGLAEIQQKRQEELRQKQDILERKQMALFDLYAEGKMPSDEFEFGMALLEKNKNELDARESKTRKLLDDLTDGKISVASYLKSVGLLRKTALTAKPENVRREDSKVKKDPIVAQKPEPKRITKTKNTAPKAKSKNTKSEVRLLRKRPSKISSITLRSKPLNDLSIKQVQKILTEKNFFDSFTNKQGKGLQHQYKTIKRKGQRLTIDRTTGLTWQHSGSSQELAYSDVEGWVQEMNKQRFAGYDDWRLPTLEEAMSLLEPESKNGNLHIDPAFDQAQEWIWTADNDGSGVRWVVYFYGGYCGQSIANANYYVRAVRGGKQTAEFKVEKEDWVAAKIMPAEAEVFSFRDSKIEKQNTLVTLKIPPKSIHKTHLRSELLHNYLNHHADHMLREKNFFDSSRNKQGKGLPHQYEVIERDGEKLVIDHTTGLTWQQAGSSEKVVFADVEKYIDKLNSQLHSGEQIYDDWRLPTLEEAMSLMEPQRHGGEPIALYIDPVFDFEQGLIWTADKMSVGMMWVVNFGYGHCYGDHMSYNYYIRAVR